MNHKELNIIAHAINHAYHKQKDTDSGTKAMKQLVVRSTAESIAEALKAEDPHFKRGAFMWECGVK